MKNIFLFFLAISFGFVNLAAAQTAPERDTGGEYEENYDEDDLYGEDFYEYEETEDESSTRDTGN